MTRLPDRLRQFFLPERAVVRAGPYAVVAAIGLALGLAIGSLSLVYRLEWALYDRMMAIATRDPSPPSDIVVVAIDEPSFTELGLQWPWPRRLHAALIDALVKGGARAIVFDIVFVEPSNTEDDTLLAEAVRRAGNVVLASNLATVTDRAYVVQQWTEPMPALAQAAAAVGAAGMPIDPDGVLRRASLVVDGRPTLAVAAAEKQAGLAVSRTESSPLIHFIGPPRQGIVTVSYYQVVEPGLLPAGAVRDKIVFVGQSLSTAAALDRPDHFRTPVAVLMPGVEVHATLLDTILRRRAIADPFGSYRSLVAWGAAIAVIVALVSFRLSLHTAVFALAGLAVMLTVASYVALSIYNLRLPIVGPMVAVGALFATTTAYRFALGQRERRLITRAFKNYVAPAIVQQMLDDPSRLTLSGEAREVTVLFTDLEGFTTISEGLTPERLRATLSSYFKAMMDLLLAERATLDKFIGDAIMVYFGCPIPDPAHPQQACRAALAMQRGLARLNEEWRRRGSPELRMRIGVNTGIAVAGNLGTDTIFNYTILGDCVNLASRLEGVNKEYGTLVIVGADTWSRVSTQFEARELDWIRVKGKAQPVAIFELMAEAGQLTDADRAARDRFGEGLSRYRARQWREAAESFRTALEARPGDPPSAIFLERCAEYLDAPPPAEWDGVHVMHTK